jgi:hypothetical protein
MLRPVADTYTESDAATANHGRSRTLKTGARPRRTTLSLSSRGSRELAFASREGEADRVPTLVIQSGEAPAVAPPDGAPLGPVAALPPPLAATAGGTVAAPASGALFGAWTADNTGLTLEQREAQINARYAIVHRYHDWNDAFPTAVERKWAGEGRTLFINWVSRIYGTTTIIPWDAIAAGHHDATIDAQAERVEALGVPVMLTFMHEPEDEVGTAYGSAEDFAAAFRRVRERFVAAGAHNVSWVWNVMGYSGHWALYDGLYPGDDAVDWIAWDPYNWYTCHRTSWRTFAEKVSSFYTWLMANGHGDKPFMLAEFGSTEHSTDAAAKGDWFHDALAEMKGGSFPNLKALVYFDSNKTGECDWRVDSSPAALEGYGTLATDPFMNP